MLASAEKVNSYQPIEALRGMVALVRDPKDTAQVFRIVKALSGNALFRMHARYRRVPSGQQILAEQRELLPSLVEHDVLRAMPKGSLGRAYLAFLEAEGITSEGLVAASDAGYEHGPRSDDPEYLLVANRLRDMHDLWHVVTGYDGDLVGEGALLAFTLPQTMNLGVGCIVAVSWIEGIGESRREIARGLWRGVRAAWMPAQDWEALLPLPLDEVRRRLRVGAPPAYRRVRTNEWRPGAIQWLLGWAGERAQAMVA